MSQELKNKEISKQKKNKGRSWPVDLYSLIFYWDKKFKMKTRERKA